MQLGLSREFESYQGEVWQLDGSWLQIFGRFVDESTDLIEKTSVMFISQAVMLSGEAASGNFPLEAVA